MSISLSIKKLLKDRTECLLRFILYSIFFNHHFVLDYFKYFKFLYGCMCSENISDLNNLACYVKQEKIVFCRKTCLYSSKGLKKIGAELRF